MIRKTMTIISIAILVAAISVATTMTMIQADNDSDVGALFGPDTGQLGVTPNPILGGSMEHFYADVTGSTAAVGFSSAASLSGGYLDASEPSIQSGVVPANPVFIPGLVLYLSVGPCIPVTPALDVYKGFEESVFTFDSLTVGNLYEVTVDISDMDDFGVFTEATCTTPALETVFVTANTVELGSVVADIGAPTGALKTKTFTSQVERADGLGDMTVGFNQLFSWDPIGIGITGLCDPVQVAANNCIGLESGIRVEQISLVEKTGDVEKAIIDCDDIEIKQTTTTLCTFNITYSGDSAVIVDTVNAEWKVNDITTGPSVDAELTFLDDGSASGTIDSMSELTIDVAGFNVPDGTFTFSSSGDDATVDFVDLNNDRSIQANELTISDAGTSLVANATEFISANTEGGICTIDVDTDTGLTGKNKKQNMKSATGITCDAETDDIFAIVSIETRESPDTKKHSNKDPKFKPTSCTDEFFLNEDGASAILLDPSGAIVLTGDPGEPAVLDTSEPLSVEAIAGAFGCDD